MNAYLNEIKPYLGLAFLVFAGASAFGYVLAFLDPTETLHVQRGVYEQARPLLDLQSWQIALLIFLNNSIKVFFSMALGLVFAFVPILFLFVNGQLLGTFAFLVQDSHGWGFFTTGIIPHGIIEIPAVLVGAAFGIRLGFLAFSKLFGPKSEISLKQEIKRAVSFYLRVLLPVFFLAALVEAYISPFFLALFYSVL